MPTPSLSTFGLRIQEEYVVVSVAGREASDGSVLLAAVVVMAAPAAAAGSAVLSFLAPCSLPRRRREAEARELPESSHVDRRWRNCDRLRLIRLDADWFCFLVVRDGLSVRRYIDQCTAKKGSSQSLSSDFGVRLQHGHAEI